MSPYRTAWVCDVEPVAEAAPSRWWHSVQPVRSRVAAACAVVTLALALVPTLGCSSLTEAKYGANALAASLDAAAPVLRAECIEPFSGADGLTPDEASKLLLAYDRSPCPRALRAYETARSAHRAYYATILAIEAGDCANVSRSVTKCDLIGRTNDAVQAGAALASVMKALVDE